MAELEIHTVVALLDDLRDQGLVRGQVGTIVEEWTPGVYEVEFSSDAGKTYAMAAVKAEQLMQLQHQPTSPAAWAICYH